LGIFLVKPESMAHHLFVTCVLLGQEPELLEKYANFVETFNKKKVAELPFINSPIYMIKLEEGAKPPHSLIYALAEPEQKAL
jgi:hypothetical protein